MIINKKLIILSSVFIFFVMVGVGIGVYLSFTNKDALGATGSPFNLVYEYIADTPQSGGVATTTSTSVASTTPIYFTANSTTTVTMLTAGVSDIRFNVIAHATSTVEGAGPQITIAPMVRANNGIDRYNQTVVTTSGVTQVATPIQTYYLNASATTTATATLAPDDENFFAGSIQISNLNAPYIVFAIGATVASDIHLEIQKVVPNQ